MSSNLTSPTIFGKKSEDRIAEVRRGIRVAEIATSGGVGGVARASWKFRREWLWPVLVAALIIAASSRSRVAAPEGIAHVDKIAHFSVYGLLATLLCRLQPGWRGATWGLAGASLFGLTDEWHQSFVPGRATDIGDWIADTAGAAVAVGLYAGVGGYRRLLESPVGWRKRKSVKEPRMDTHGHG